MAEAVGLIRCAGVEITTITLMLAVGVCNACGTCDGVDNSEAKAKGVTLMFTGGERNASASNVGDRSAVNSGDIDGVGATVDGAGSAVKSGSTCSDGAITSTDD
jgi:hypothetical protein